MSAREEQLARLARAREGEEERQLAADLEACLTGEPLGLLGVSWARMKAGELAGELAGRLLTLREERAAEQRRAELEEGFGLTEAQEVAALWHRGQGSALYRLSSSGLAGGRAVLEVAELEAEQELQKVREARQVPAKAAWAEEEQPRLELLVTWLGLMIRGAGEGGL